MANLDNERVIRIVDRTIENLVGEIEEAVQDGTSRLLSELEWDTLSGNLDNEVGSALRDFLKSVELPEGEPETP